MKPFYGLRKKNVIPITDINDASFPASFIRFEERREKFIWSRPTEIYFVISDDHYVKALIKKGKETKWVSRHNTLKELLLILPNKNFVRLNKFYLLNLDHFSRIDYINRILYFKDDSSIPIPHRISPFLHHLLKSNHT